MMAARPNAQGETPWTMERVLDTFPRLGQRLQHDGSFLSGGEQQMLSIGRALTTNPDLIILDEATEGLAPLIRDEIWKIIGDIKASGIASIIVDKNIDNLLKVAEKHIVLVKGEVVYSGNSQGLRDDPSILNTHLGVG